MNEGEAVSGYRFIGLEILRTLSKYTIIFISNLRFQSVLKLLNFNCVIVNIMEMVTAKAS